MQQWKLILAYDGTAFRGWQVQPRLPTVQGTLAAAIRTLTGEEVLPQGSGRTDAGVHALGQVASFALRAPIPEINFLRALNRALPGSIRALSAEHARDDFHARHSARQKTYEYRIFDRRCESPAPAGQRIVTSDRVCPPMLAPYVWDCPFPLHLDRLAKAARYICGEHDFSSFAAADPDLTQRETDAQTTTVRRILESRWRREGDLLVYCVTGTGFLHHMVRNLVGTFVEVGRGRFEPEQMVQILARRDRAAAGPTAPASGLFLLGVGYDEAAHLDRLESESAPEPVHE
jgi:tRNA pseudouridine38-40 synthase